MVRRSLIPLLLAAFTAAAPVAMAQSDAPDSASPPTAPTGLWLTSDGAGVVAITQCGDTICGHFAAFRKLPAPQNWQGATECKFEFIHQLRRSPDNNGLWQGSITDPTTGDDYNATVERFPDGSLHLRGYLGIPLLGRTEVWKPYSGSVSNDCEMQ